MSVRNLSPSQAASRTLNLGSLVLAFLVGAFLRLDQILLQIPADDEFHGIYAALTRGYLDLLSHFGDADYCIPLALFYRLAMDFLWLDELVLRLGPLLFGLGALIVVPLLVRTLADVRTAATMTAWFLAVSPLHIYFTRYARPYSIGFLLAFVGTVAFYLWWTSGRKHWAAIYISCAVLGPYFHLSFVFVLWAPFLFSLLELLRGVEGPVTWRQWVWLLVLCCIGLVLLLGPPVWRDFSALTQKVHDSRISPGTVLGAAHLLAGSRNVWIVLAAVAALIAGARILVALQPRLALYLGLMVSVQAGALLLLAPAAVEFPIVPARYSIGLLPWFLVVAALAVVRGSGFLGRGAVLVPPVLGLVLLALGPLPEIYYAPNNWTNHGLFQYDYDYAPQRSSYSTALRPEHVPAFYLELGRMERDRTAVVEAPWYHEWHYNHYPHLQRVHQQRMFIGYVDDPQRWSRPGELPLADSRLQFRHFVHVADLEGIRARGAQFVIFHKNLVGEFASELPPPAVDVTGWVEFYRRHTGPPVFEDAFIVVFDVGKPHGPERRTRVGPETLSAPSP